MIHAFQWVWAMSTHFGYNINGMKKWKYINTVYLSNLTQHFAHCLDGHWSVQYVQYGIEWFHLTTVSFAIDKNDQQIDIKISTANQTNNNHNNKHRYYQMWSLWNAMKKKKKKKCFIFIYDCLCRAAHHFEFIIFQHFLLISKI